MKGEELYQKLCECMAETANTEYPDWETELDDNEKAAWADLATQLENDVIDTFAPVVHELEKRGKKTAENPDSKAGKWIEGHACASKQAAHILKEAYSS